MLLLSIEENQELKLAIIFFLSSISFIVFEHLYFLPKKYIFHKHESKRGFEYCIIIKRNSTNFSRQVGCEL